jgi:hypothetical protein
MQDHRRRKAKNQRRDDHASSPEWQHHSTPIELRPIDLRDEPAHEIDPVKVESRSMPIVELGDKRTQPVAVDEHRLEARSVEEKRHAVRTETERPITLKATPVTEMKMRELQERRVEARDLGWKVSGARIRLETGDGEGASPSTKPVRRTRDRSR